MGRYGVVAVKAVNNYQTNEITPRDAWELAAHEVFTSKSSRDKGCPRSAFLVLCEEGLVISIPSGKYCNAKENKIYVLKAVDLLKKSPTTKYDETTLWQAVMGDEKKKYNQQMDVVLSLWTQGCIYR
jgi:hypothetical protein